MPHTRRGRTIAAPADELWRIVSDPHHRPRWWPGVERVEEASRERWTDVFRTRRGRTVRADFTRLASERNRLLRWRQDVDATPFERFLTEAITELRLEPARDAERTHVELSTHQRLRGAARLGALRLRGVTRRQLDEALAALDHIAGR